MKKRIAVYKDNLSTGRGADRAVRNFAVALSERDFDVVLFDKAELDSRLKEAFDVFVATGSNEVADLDRAGYFGRADRAIVVLQLHLAPRGFFKWRHPFRNRAIRKAFDKVDVAQVLCRSYEKEFRAIAPHPKIVTIGNWTDMSAPTGFIPSADSRTILYPAAALNKVKNQKCLIRAFAALADDFPDWKIRLLGKDTSRYACECHREIKRLRLQNRVEIVGFTNDLKGEYSRAAFVAFPSKLEGFPLAILEAAQFGLCAVVHKDLPGVEDIVQVDKTGVVVENSVAAFASGLRNLMASAEYRLSLGIKAREYCREHYSRDNIMGKWNLLLENKLVLEC